MSGKKARRSHCVSRRVVDATSGVILTGEGGMDLHANKCLVCGRAPRKMHEGAELVFRSCDRCGPYSATHLGELSVIFKYGKLKWSDKERSLLSGCIRSRKIRGASPPKFGYKVGATEAQLASFDTVDKMLAGAPQSVEEQADQTLLNLSLMCGDDRGKWLSLNRETDLSVGYAQDIDELDMILRGMREEGYVKYQLTSSDLLVQLTFSGWRHAGQIQEMGSFAASGVEIFFSYCHEDEKLRDQLEAHLAPLQREGAISSWHDRKIGPGEEWEKTIDDHLEKAAIILLLISADFMQSEYCWGKELTRAMERHKEGSARVIPVIARDCDWKRAPFGKLQALPKDGKAITSWLNRDEAFADVARGVRLAVEELKGP